MKQQTFIFIGKSGSGKGTQADLLEDYLKKNDPEKRDVYHIITGNLLRELAKKDTYTSKVTANTLSKGELLPDFLAVTAWGNFFIENLKNNEHIITDGMPRKLHEAIMLERALKFYGREKPVIINIDLSNDSVVKRLLLRKRYDDTKEAIEERLKFYEADVSPVIEYYKKSSECIFLSIDGEPDVKTINKEIMSKLKEIGSI